MYSSCCNPATSRIEYSDNFFQEKSLVNDTPISWKSQFRVKRCATATVSFMFVNVFQIHLYITVEIFSHQQSHGVFFYHQVQNIRDWPIAGDYLVSVFSSGRFIRWGNPITLSRFLRNRRGIVPASTKSFLIQVWNLLDQSQKVTSGKKNVTRVRQSYPCLSY